MRTKILFLITKSTWGGAQRYVFDLATNLDKERFEPVVALGGEGPLAFELEKQGVRVIRIQNLVRDISLLQEVRAAIELWRIIRAERPDILHINSSKAGGLGAMIGRLARVPSIIFTAHGWAFNEMRPPLSRLLIKILHACTIVLAHRTITVSKTLKAQLDIPFIQRKMIVIRNGRTIASFMERDKARVFLMERIPALRAYPDDFWAVTIAELHPVKQHDVMIRAIAQCVNEHPTLRHVIIGEGEERKKLAALIQELHLEAHVFLAGGIHEASRMLPAFDLFVLPSRSEALAYVIIEACIAGLPIIASEVGGIPEIITNDRSGVLFPQGDVRALVRAIDHVMNDDSYRTTLAQEAKKRSKDLTFEKMFGETVALYDSMNSRAT